MIKTNSWNRWNGMRNVAHSYNNTIRKNFTVKSVKASHKKGEAEITSEEPIDEQKLREAVKETGYTVTSVTSEAFKTSGRNNFS